MAKPIAEQHAIDLIIDALEFLGQQPESELRLAGLKDVWHWAICHWDIEKVPKTQKIKIPSD